MQYPIIPLFGGLGTYYTPKICLILLLVQINHYLAKNSLIVATGSVNIIDATVIEAKQCRSKKNKQGDNTQEPEAAWNVKTASDGRRKSTYGFKLHTNTDEYGYQENDLYAWQCA